MCFPVIIKPPELKLRHKLTVLPKIRPGPDPCCVIACCSGVRGTSTSKRRGHSTKRCNRPSAPGSVVTREWLYSRVRMSRFRCIMMPVHLNGNHWARLAADVAGRTVGLVDTLPPAQHSCTCSRHTWLHALGRLRKSWRTGRRCHTVSDGCRGTASLGAAVGS